eukprot:TRINITY_DN92392_c0_g1_i1.p1 TRINITY_DN92392_c0_g1~~TRINITY_DN92392_c0_g1_i1.p1  ORF type:complete len:132 (-),score=24.00 TRINITY_DN92392_c0_g1_i1:47-442(-)
MRLPTILEHGHRGVDRCKVEVSLISGETVLESELASSCSIAELKLQLEDVSGVPSSELRLLLGDAILQDGSCLGDVVSSCSLEVGQLISITMVRSLHRMALSGGRDRKLLLWDLSRGEDDRDFVGQTKSVR